MTYNAEYLTCKTTHVHTQVTLYYAQLFDTPGILSNCKDAIFLQNKYIDIMLTFRYGVFVSD